MKEKIELSDFPFEIQKRVLDRLGDKDHVSMHRVSKSWQFMISKYLRIVFQFKCAGTYHIIWNNLYHTVIPNWGWLIIDQSIPTLTLSDQDNLSHWFFIRFAFACESLSSQNIWDNNFLSPFTSMVFQINEEPTKLRTNEMDRSPLDSKTNLRRFDKH